MEKYTVIKEIGKGSFGVAILCERKDDKKKCVIKQISMLKMPAKEVSRTLQESDLLGKLRHPNIISLYESFVEKGNQKLAIVMEYANGG
jgi:serine/threonine protein kinase